jgi:predicted amino acid-binding ACT domain protein
MSNESSKEIPDTRGRPRDENITKLVDQIEGAYMKNRLPFEVASDSPKKDAKKLRLSASFQEMQKELGINFRVMAQSDTVIVTLRKG